MRSRSRPCPSPARRWARSRVLIAALVTLTGTSVAAQPAPHGYWRDTLRYDGRAWDVGLQLAPEAGTVEALLDMAATYTALTPPDTFAVDGGRMMFDLPWGIGRFEGIVEEGGIAGAVTLRTGEAVPLRLQRSQRRPIRREDLTVENGEVTIAATLALPATSGPHPLVVLVHGAGDSTRENVWFFADYFARAGIACLVYDKRGNGQSTGDWRAVGFEPRARDVVAALEAVRSHPSVDPDRTGLIGVSQGSWVSGIAADLDPEIDFVIHVSGPAVSPYEADTYSVLAALRAEQWDPEAIRERVRLWELSTAFTRSGTDEVWGRLQAAIDSVRSRPWFQTDPYEPGREGWFRTWYHRVLDYDPVPTLQRLDIPMLWIYGERDTQSDVVHNVAVLDRLRREGGKPYRTEVFEAAGHGLVVPVDALGSDDGVPGMAPGYLELVVNWIGAVPPSPTD